MSLPVKFTFLYLCVFLLSLSSSFPEVEPRSLHALEIKSKKFAEIPLTDEKRGSVIIFLSSRCPCSASHLPEIIQLIEEFSPLGLQFIMVHSNADEKEEIDRRYFEKLAITTPILADPNSEIANRFGAVATPHAFVVSPEGKILYKGAVTDRQKLERAHLKYLRLALEEIVKGKSVTIDTTRAVGCLIQRPR